VFVVVSRQVLIASRFSTVICAPVYTACEGLSTQVPIGPKDGVKHRCSIHCDELVSLPKSLLTDYVGCLSKDKLNLLDKALKSALQIRDD
jgi:mRNA interferase MazF